MSIPVEFLLFGATLIGVAVLHRHTLAVALTGLAAIATYKVMFAGFPAGTGIPGLLAHLAHEWVILANLLCLLLGFSLLSRHFEDSRVPDYVPRLLPDDWRGPLVLLVIVFVLSAFLDNIAAALIGATVAGSLFRHRVHVGYLAAVVAASNAGGSGSVVGDTTTTMMWLDGVSPVDVFAAYAAAIPALIAFGVPAALQQHRHSPMAVIDTQNVRIDWVRISIVIAILVVAIITNVTVNLRYRELSESFPFIGIAVWMVILATAPLRRPEWSLLPEAFRGALFLLALVTCASMMPVQHLPAASWMTALGLGFVSAVFDNIPLTALALKQGGYDWGMLAYSVGFGGSMIWFGSSAGVAVSNLYPEAKSVWLWLRSGWHVVLAYVMGFVIMLLALGWNPHAPHKGAAAAPVVYAPVQV